MLHPFCTTLVLLLATHAVIIPLPLTNLQQNGHATALGLGTPPQPLTLVIDTGVSLTAASCAPCAGCPAGRPPFDPAASRSFHRVLCNETPACGGCAAGFCPFAQSFAEGSLYKN